MQSKFASALTVMSFAATAIAVAVFAVGPGVALALAALSGLAFLAWLTIGAPDGDASDGVVSPYLISVPLFMALSTARYLSGWPTALTIAFPQAFSHGFVMNDANWFFVFVCLPASLLLLGGHFLSRRLPIGHYMAWWASFFAVGEGFLQLRVTSLSALPQSPFAAAGAAIAIALALCGLAIVQRLLSAAAAEQPVPAPLTARQVNLWTLLFLALIVVYAVNVFVQAGAAPVFIIVGSMAFGLICWRLTTAKRPADPSWAVPAFTLLLSLFYFHVGEEALTGFSRAFSAISGHLWDDAEFMIVIFFVGPIFWFFAAWSLWKREPFGNFIFWFMIVGMILGEPAHVITFPMMAMSKFGVPYQYFSGMYTALFPMAPAIVSLARIVRERRAAVV